MSKKYAVVKRDNHLVLNTIVAPEGFTMEGYEMIELDESNASQPGAYYNPGDGKFYGDVSYKTDYHQINWLN